MRKSNKPKFPIDIPLAGVTLEGGAVFVTLRTLDELEDFWNKHREALPFAVQGIQYGEKQHYLNPHEWIFAPTKAAVVKTVFRWDQMGIRCEWDDWANESPEDHASWFRERDEYRERKIARGEWSADDEADYQSDCKARSPETYRGTWRLYNLPCGMDYLDWFSVFDDEIIDPDLPIEVVAKMMQEQTFDDWRGCPNEIEFEDTESLNDEIAYWRAEQRRGCGYYGQKNEAADYAFRNTDNGGAGGYDTWFRDQVQAALDDPRPSIPHEQAKEQFDEKKRLVREKIAAQQEEQPSSHSEGRGK